MSPVLFGVIAVVLVISLVFILRGALRGASFGGAKLFKGNDAAIKEATRKLSQNPNDPEALFTLANAYFDDSIWDKAMKTYETLIEQITQGHAQQIDNFTTYLRYGISSKKLGLIEQAYKGFSTARTFRQDNFEVNYELGALEFDRKNYEKAILLLKQARAQDPDSPAVLRYMGHALFRLKKPKEAMSFIRKAIDLAPDDKESLYTLAECYHEANQID